MVGHSTVLLQIAGFNLLFDPIWSTRCSPVSWAGPKRVREPAVRFADLPPIDAVVLSHDHYDHCDRATLEELARVHDPVFVVGRGVGDHLSRWGIEGARELAWWQTTHLVREDPGGCLLVDFVPARHFSARGPRDRNRTDWGGFWVRDRSADEGTSLSAYFCGDSGYDERLFSQLAEHCGSPDVAFLPIGAYSPRWFMSSVHVDPTEALLLHQTLRSRRSVGMHCATFQLTDEPIDEPEQWLKREVAAAGLTEEEFSGPDYGVRRVVERRSRNSAGAELEAALGGLSCRSALTNDHAIQVAEHRAARLSDDSPRAPHVLFDE